MVLPAFWRKYVHSCNSVGKSPNHVAEEIGIKSSGTVTGWKNGAKPRPSVLLKIANYFDKPVEYFSDDSNDVIRVLRIRELRKAVGISMKALGEAVGVSESAISQYETGKRHPDYDILLKISNLFGVSTDYILGSDYAVSKTADEELQEILEELKNREELRVLFKLSKGCTKEEIEQVVRIIEVLRKND